MKLARKWRIPMMAAVVLFVLWLVYYAAVGVICGAKLRRIRAAVAAEGSSLDLEVLAAQYAVRASGRSMRLLERTESGILRKLAPDPSVGNGAQFYLAAGYVIREISLNRDFAFYYWSDGSVVDEQHFLYIIQEAKPEERAGMAAEFKEPLTAFLETYAVALELLHEGARHEYAWFEPEYSSHPHMMLRHVGRLRGAARKLNYQAWFAALDGDGRKALQAVRTALRIRRSLENQPILLSYLVAMAMDDIALNRLSDLLAMFEPTAEDLRLVLAEVQALDRQTFRRAMEGERAHLAVMFQSARRNGLEHALRSHMPGTRLSKYPGRANALFVRAANALAMDEAYALSTATKWVEAASAMYEHRLASKDLLADERLYEDASSRFWRMRHPISYYRLRLSRSAFFSAELDVANRDVAAGGLAAELFRLDHGRYPARPDDLVPQYLDEWPKDIYTGQPMHFESLPNGVLIQSAGPEDRKDFKFWGLTWRIERPNEATQEE